MDEKTFLKEYRELVLIHTRNKIKNPQDAEDIFQETMTAAWEAVCKDKINDPAKISAYIKRIYHNKIADYFKKKESKNNTEVEFQEDDPYVTNPDHNAFEELIHDGEREKMDKALQSLSQREREILILYYYDGWSFERIADLKNKKANTVRQIASRARKKLAKKFKINY